MDMRKNIIEGPVKRLLKTTVNDSVNAEPSAQLPVSNRKVAPGLVKWHPDFATACSQSKLSGKPVLLFQMMGQLDDEFC
jgi:hypothetical protein